MERRYECPRCGREVVPYHINNAFYFCNGTPSEPHPEFLITSKLIEIEVDNPNISENKIKSEQDPTTNTP